MSTSFANAEMAEAWDREGAHWSQHADQYDATVRPYTDRLLAEARIGHAELVLDIGCGSGQTTREAARIAAGGEALGIDISRSLVDHARAVTAAEGPGNARFELGDAQVFRFPPRGFDVAISRFGAMFFGDPVAAFTNIGRAVRPGGRLALVAWQELDANEWLTSIRASVSVGRTLPKPPPGAPGPFALADHDRVARLLTDADFDDIEFEALELPFALQRSVDGTLEFLTSGGAVKGMLDGLDDDDRRAAIAGLRATLEAHEHDGTISFGSAAWLIRAGRPR